MTGRRKRFSLRRRLTLTMLLVFLVGGATAVGLFEIETVAIHEDMREQTLKGQARDLLAGLPAVAGAALDLDLPGDWSKVYADPDSGFAYTVFDRTGRPLAWAKGRGRPVPFLRPAAGRRFGRAEFTGVGPGEMALLAAAAPGGLVVVVGRPRADAEALVESVLEEEFFEQLLAFGPILLLAVAMIWLVSGWSLRRLARASDQAARIGPGSATARITTEGLPDEIRPLVDAVNRALERLAGAYVAERRLTANAAHELRTPLAVLSLRLQQARQGKTNWPEIEADLANLSRVVSQLMDLARKEGPTRDAGAAPGTANLDRIVREAAAQILPLVEAAERSLEIEHADAIEIPGHGDDLADMVQNLLHNALVHGSGTIRLSLRREAAAGDPVGQAVIAVRDDGPGLPLKDGDDLFERFRKVGQASPGAGLGLAIVRQVARRHGGDARVVGDDRGFVEVRLPLGGADPELP